MTERLWEPPMPSTGLAHGGPAFEKRAGREIALRMAWNDGAKAGADVTVTLILEGVEAFRVTYDRARDDRMLEAYDVLLDWGRTAWLEEVSRHLADHGGAPDGLRHLAMNFDDGPCYEALCRGYRLDGPSGAISGTDGGSRHT